MNLFILLKSISEKNSQLAHLFIQKCNNNRTSDKRCRYPSWKCHW